MKKYTLNRERRTLAAMLRLYCGKHHAEQPDLCDDCRELLEYANRRLDRCVFGTAKPVCSKCPVHCYDSTMRTKMQHVMRFAGPKMLWRHPFLAMGHLLDKRKPVPTGREKNAPTSNRSH